MYLLSEAYPDHPVLNFNLPKERKESSCTLSGIAKRCLYCGNQQYGMQLPQNN